MERCGKAGEVRQCAFGIGCARQGKFWLARHGWDRFACVRFGEAGIVWNGEARLVEAGLCAERFGWRVMVRLGAVLCGTVMYGLVWQERRVVVMYGLLGHDVVGCGMIRLAS